MSAQQATALLAERVACAPTTTTTTTGLPEAALEAAAAALLDCTGVMLAGSCEPAARIVASTVRAQAGVRLVGTAERASVTEAALANGTSAHALDFDDVSPAMVGHPSAVLVPALLAVAEEVDAAGERLLDAFVVGFEVAARLGRLLNPAHYERGWHATSTLGAPAAAAAVARLLRLDVATTRAALGIAGSLAAGLRVSFGSMVKPLHAGHAARTGVLAARLAAGGFTAAPQLFEAPRGFFELFGAAADWSSAFDGWDWSAPAIVRSGIQVKPFPSCACTHTGIDAMLALREQLNGQPVERIACRVSPVVPQILIHERPTTGLEGKFSMHYALAVTLLDGQPGLAQFGDERVRQDDVQSLLRRVELQTDASLVEDLTTGLLPVQVSVELADGRRLEANCELAPGSPERPLSRVQLEQKFLGNAGLVLGEERAAAALAALRGVREMPGVRRLVDYLTCQGAL